MERIFISPSRYVQGPNLLSHCAHHIQLISTSVLIIADTFIWNMLGESFTKHLTENHIQVYLSDFSGESSQAEIDRILTLASSVSIDSVLALGGGKVIDTGKMIANTLQISSIICPTVASTDAPTSAISVLYTEDGRFDHYQFSNKSPDLILVDSVLIAKAPVRMLVSGIADGLSTAVEVNAVLEANANNMVGGMPTLASIAIAKQCENIIFKHARDAVHANTQQIVSPALEAIIEANTLLSGLGFENGGLAAAHAIHNGFSSLTGQIHTLTHGEKIAYTTLTQLILENTPEQRYYQFLDLYLELGLPTTLADLHLSQNDDTLMKIAHQTLKQEDTILNMPFPITAPDIVHALKKVDEITRQYTKKTEQ